MKAFEIFSRDLAGNEFSRVGSDRRTYYLSLRQALKEEVSANVDSGLLAHYGKLLKQSAPAQLYLLDAAALWECHEAVIGAMRFPRDIGQGFPFMVGGRRLSWSEVQQLSDAGTLPVAVLDDELRARLTGLMAHIANRSRLIGRSEIPAVNGRATLATENRATSPVSASQKTQEAPCNTAELTSLREKVQQLEAEIARLNSQPHHDYDAAYTAELILRNRMDEALAQARQAGGRLQEALEQLIREQAESADLAEQAAQAEAELQALRIQKASAAKAAAAAQAERDQLQREAAECLQAKEAAEAELAAVRQQLSDSNAALRKAQRLAADTAAAARLTHMQAERLH